MTSSASNLRSSARDLPLPAALHAEWQWSFLPLGLPREPRSGACIDDLQKAIAPLDCGGRNHCGMWLALRSGLALGVLLALAAVNKPEVAARVSFRRAEGRRLLGRGGGQAAAAATGVVIPDPPLVAE